MKKIIACILICLFSFSCSAQKDDSFDVLALGLPENVMPEVSGINMGAYILKQTHETFLRNDTDGKYYSHLFADWKRNHKYDDFTFCLKKELSFSEGSVYKIPQFKKDISKLLDKYRLKSQIIVAKECLTVNLKKPAQQLLKYLTMLENAPSLKIENKKYEYGLGHYNVDSMTEDKIILKRKKVLKGAYNRIVFHKFKGNNDNNLSNENVEDFNRVYLSQIPGWVKEKYANYELPLFQTVNLILNIENDNLRKNVYNCIDVTSLRSSFMNNQERFLDVKNILPIGMIGAEKGKVENKCLPSKSIHKDSVVFLNWRSGNEKSVDEYFSKLSSLSGFNFKVRHEDESYLIKTAFKNKHPYQLYIVALDSELSTPQSFVKYFYEKGNNLVDYHIDTLKENNEKLSDINKKEQYTQIKKILKILEEKNVVLPLYQEVRKFYYPRDIKGFEFTKVFIQYPDISELRI